MMHAINNLFFSIVGVFACSNTYGYGDELLHQSDHVSVDNSSVGTSVAGSESKRKITARGKINSANPANAATAQNSRKSAGNIRRKTELLDGQVRLSVAEILQISVDAYVSHWTNYISNGEEHIRLFYYILMRWSRY
jgi:hypothetical protein